MYTTHTHIPREGTAEDMLYLTYNDQHKLIGEVYQNKKNKIWMFKHISQEKPSVCDNPSTGTTNIINIDLVRVFAAIETKNMINIARVRQLEYYNDEFLKQVKKLDPGSDIITIIEELQKTNWDTRKDK